jgi:regulator of sigma E protease
MEMLLTGLLYTFWFLIILTIVVFIHEFGHFIIARLNGVQIDVFSIGFGKELFGFTDKRGTRWKISAIPMGGYVKMFGDQDAASSQDSKSLEGLSFKEKQLTFHFKKLWQKAAIVVAGPAANYLSAILIIAALSFTYGISVTEPIIGEVLKASPAAKAGLKVGDEILEVDGSTVESFEDVRQIIALSTSEPIELLILREHEEIEVEIIPELRKMKDAYGNDIEMPVIGISSHNLYHKEQSFFGAIATGVEQSYTMSLGMLKALGQIIVGDRGLDQLGGPIKIAQYSGQSAKHGVVSVLWFIAVISINLGLLNLMPLPMLDGGHLFYYMVEAVTGKPVSEKFQLVAMKASLFFLISLMLFVTINDIRSLFGA